MTEKPTLVFIPGAWYSPQCFEKVIKLLGDEHGFECISITLPSTNGDPNATFKDDVDAACSAIVSEITASRDVVVIAHSYGGHVGNSCIKGLTRPQPDTTHSAPSKGYVTALILIASGFTFTGVAFMDPLFGIPPPYWRKNKETGFAEPTSDDRKLFYPDIPCEECEYWVSQLKTHSLKSLFEGGAYAYAGWKDGPTWYIGTLEDRALPVLVQRIAVELARGQGGTMHHFELAASHSPFLSMPAEVVAGILQAVKTVGGLPELDIPDYTGMKGVQVPAVEIFAPGTWVRFGLPLAIGREIGWGFWSYYGVKKLFTPQS